MSPDDAEFHQVYESAFPIVYRTAYRLSGRRDVAEEAAQEAFARAFARWGRLRGQPWIIGWLLTTALNIVRRTAPRAPPSTSAHLEKTRNLDAVDDALDLWRAIGRLPTRQQEAVVLHYLADLPVSQTAAVMRCREGTAKAHLDRGRRRLAQLLEPWGVMREE